MEMEMWRRDVPCARQQVEWLGMYEGAGKCGHTDGDEGVLRGGEGE
jgi:hypothetical protein